MNPKVPFYSRVTLELTLTVGVICSSGPDTPPTFALLVD